MQLQSNSPETNLFKPKKKLEVLTMPAPKDRVIAIGDIHGCHEEFQKLIVKLNPTKDDLVVLLGDLVDRGPDSEGVVQLFKALKEDRVNIDAVLGNHDEALIRYHYHTLLQKENPGYKIPMKFKPTYFQLSTDSLKVLASLPHAVFIDKTEDYQYPIAFVHAGLSPSGFRQNPNAFIRNRYFTKNARTNILNPVKSVELDGLWYVPEGSWPWYHFWDGRWTVVYGHSVQFKPEVVNNTIGCDGGCCFGGVLRAWVLPRKGTSFFVEIPAKKEYSL